MNICVSQFNGITYDVEKELRERGHNVTNITKDLKEFKKLDRMVTWNEVRSFGNDKIIEKANKIGIGTVLLQHGRRGTSRIYPPFNEGLLCQKVCVWGENDKKRLMEVGTPEDRIFVCGTPLFKHLKPRVKHEGINVVFCPEHWGEEVPENVIVAGTIRRLKGVKITTKVLEGEHNLNQYDNVVVSHRNTPEHLEIVASVLSTADVIVCISESTFELLAESLDIPVVVADIWQRKSCLGDERFKNFGLSYSDACVKVKDITKLNDAIMYAIKHPEHLREERKNIAIMDGGIKIGNPEVKIADVICSK